jgi:hypothetical protein
MVLLFQNHASLAIVAMCLPVFGRCCAAVLTLCEDFHHFNNRHCHHPTASATITRDL